MAPRRPDRHSRDETYISGAALRGREEALWGVRALVSIFSCAYIGVLLFSSICAFFGWIESDDPMRNAIELRKANRYQLSAPALFLWATQEGKPQSGRGVTRDMNASGVYVLTDALPPVGALVQLDILLPKLVEPGFGMSLAGEGVVLRVDSRGSNGAGAKGAGFAASVQFYPEEAASVLSRLGASR